MDADDIRASTPICTTAEVATLVGMPTPTVYSWTRKRGHRPALVHTVANDLRGWPTIPVVGLAEAHVIRALRSMDIRMSKIAEVVNWLRNEANDPFALASPKLVTDGIDLYVQRDADLERAFDGQRPIKETIADHLREIDVWPDGYAGGYSPERLGPAIQIDARFSAGRMSFVRNRVPLFAVAGGLIAGDSPESVAADYGLNPDEIALVERNLDWLKEAA
jgi:hypothetical protein